MTLARVGETCATRLRSFSFPAENAAHLKSTAKFSSFQEVRAAVSGPGVLLFVEKKHLPPDLEAEMQDLKGYASLHYLVFSRGISWLHIGDAPPPSFSDAVVATHAPCKGFPITAPKADDQVNPIDAYSFGESELRGFLGEFSPEAGHMLCLSLPPAGQGADYYRGVLPGLLEMLG